MAQIIRHIYFRPLVVNHDKVLACDVQFSYRHSNLKSFVVDRSIAADAYENPNNLRFSYILASLYTSNYCLLVHA